MKTNREVMRMARDLLSSAHVATDLVWKRHDCIEALREALARPDQAPVAVIQEGVLRWYVPHDKYSVPTVMLKGYWPLYTTPQSAEREQALESSACLPDGIRYLLPPLEMTGHQVMHLAAMAQAAESLDATWKIKELPTEDGSPAGIGATTDGQPGYAMLSRRSASQSAERAPSLGFMSLPPEERQAMHDSHPGTPVQRVPVAAPASVASPLTEQDAELLEQAASMLEDLSSDQLSRGNCSAAEGASCSAHAVRRLGVALLATQAAPTAAAGPSITIDFKQAAELLELFGGEPTEITLIEGEGHSGKGLYAYYSELPEEGAVYLGVTDDEAAPAPQSAEREHAFESSNCRPDGIRYLLPPLEMTGHQVMHLAAMAQAADSLDATWKIKELPPEAGSPAGIGATTDGQPGYAMLSRRSASQSAERAPSLGFMSLPPEERQAMLDSYPGMPSEREPVAEPADFHEMWAGYLKDGETPFERFIRERKDLQTLLTLYGRVLEENERLKDALVFQAAPVAAQRETQTERLQSAPAYEKPTGPFTGAGDPLYPEAVELVKKHKRGSISLVQRHLRIGYNRAAYMLEAMVGTVLAEMPPTKKLLPDGSAALASQVKQGGA